MGAKSEQSMELANSIKDDMIPFIEKEAIDIKEQNELRGKQKLVKDMRTNVIPCLLRCSENWGVCTWAKATINDPIKY